MADGGPLAGFLAGFQGGQERLRQQALDNIASILQQHQIDLSNQQQDLAQRQFAADQAYRNWQQGFETQKFASDQDYQNWQRGFEEKKFAAGQKSEADQLAAKIQQNKDDYDQNFQKMLTMGGMGVGLAGVLTRMNRERLDRGNAPLDLSHYGLPGIEVPPEGAVAPYNTYRTDALPGATIFDTPQALASGTAPQAAPPSYAGAVPPSAIDLPQMLMAQAQAAPAAAPPPAPGVDQASLYASPVGVPGQQSLIPYNMPLPPRVVGATPPATVDDLISALYPNAGPDVRAALSQPLPGVSSLIEHRDVLNRVGTVNAQLKEKRLPYEDKILQARIDSMNAGTKQKLFNLGFGAEKLKRYIAMTPLTIDQARKRLLLTDRQITHSDLSSTYLKEMITDIQTNRPLKQFGLMKPLYDTLGRAQRDVEEGQKALDDNNEQTSELQRTVTSLSALIDQATSKGLTTVKISGEDFPIDYAEKLRAQYQDQVDQLANDYADKAVALDTLKQNLEGMKSVGQAVMGQMGKTGAFTPVNKGGSPTGFSGLPGMGAVPSGGRFGLAPGKKYSGPTAPPYPGSTPAPAQTASRTKAAAPSGRPDYTKMSTAELLSRLAKKAQGK